MLKKKQFEPFGDVDLGILVAADMRPLAVTTLGWRIPDVYTTMLLLEGHLLGSRCLYIPGRYGSADDWTLDVGGI